MNSPYGWSRFADHSPVRCNNGPLPQRRSIPCLALSADRFPVRETRKCYTTRSACRFRPLFSEAALRDYADRRACLERAARADAEIRRGHIAVRCTESRTTPQRLLNVSIRPESWGALAQGGLWFSAGSASATAAELDDGQDRTNLPVGKRLRRRARERQGPRSREAAEIGQTVSARRVLFPRWSTFALNAPVHCLQREMHQFMADWDVIVSPPFGGSPV